MARKTGKAARRQTRQKRARRGSQSRTMQPGSAAPGQAREASPAPPATPVAAPAPTATSVTSEPSPPPPGRRSRSGSRLATSGSTDLGHVRDDYHYVERDLRNIAVLVALMALILAAATVAFNVFDLGPA